jgi:hypothetical protein
VRSSLRRSYSGLPRRASSTHSELVISIELRIPEIQHFCHDIPCLLIGCKRDLRMNRRVIDSIYIEMAIVEEAEAVAKRIGAVCTGSVQQ